MFTFFDGNLLGFYVNISLYKKKLHCFNYAFYVVTGRCLRGFHVTIPHAIIFSLILVTYLVEFVPHNRYCSRLLLKCDGTRAETRFRLSAKRTSPFNPLNAELNSICHLLASIGAHHILHVSRIRVK
jgi:hypothetical protein